ncbi:hypothetical protein KSP39_PZI021426 [Platanthera zijinensis]|uniref:Uncharacterized protein n=1 Tax=Platanthera zijinensis TaxID=2320716 RepID=A0AAP0FWK4_9ASPA
MQAFYSAGGEEADSYYQSFSIELLEAALNVNSLSLSHFLSLVKINLTNQSIISRIQYYFFYFILQN